eukprot:6225967-Lingulodinium_polyedra.AAC.1
MELGMQLVAEPESTVKSTRVHSRTAGFAVGCPRAMTAGGSSKRSMPLDSYQASVCKVSVVA